MTDLNEVVILPPGPRQNELQKKNFIRYVADNT